ncbi:MAG: hypothetical protein ACLTXI_00110 [Collinsella sp.]
MEKRVIQQRDGSMALGYVVADQRQLDKRLYEAVTAVNLGCLQPGALMRYPDGVLEMRYRLAGETLSSAWRVPSTASRPASCSRASPTRSIPWSPRSCRL